MVKIKRIQLLNINKHGTRIEKEVQWTSIVINLIPFFFFNSVQSLTRNKKQETRKQETSGV